MNLLTEIRTCLAIPPAFGLDCPYARFSRVQDDRSAGEDITLEFQPEDLASDGPVIVFTHSEWRDDAGRLDTRPVCTVAIDYHSGHVLESSADAVEAAAQRVRSALKHADQLELVA